jgi:hypothetical protein
MAARLLPSLDFLTAPELTSFDDAAWMARAELHEGYATGAQVLASGHEHTARRRWLPQLQGHPGHGFRARIFT